MYKLLMVMIVLLNVAVCPAQAQEFFGLGGLVRDIDTSESSRSWQLEYNEGLGEHFAYSVSYLNEGHLPDHHRDGQTVQIWTRTMLLDRRLALAAGIGPFYYFDTARAGTSYTNNHGWGGNASLSATWYTEDRWLLQLRSNFIETFSGVDTLSALVGIGYQLEAPPVRGARPRAAAWAEKSTNNEVTVYIGRAIVNSLSQDQSLATGIEYRRGLLPYLEGSVAWLYEGDKRLTRRNGVSTQLWAVKDFFAGQLSLGVGAGPYFSVDHYKHDNGNQERARVVSGVVTMSAGYRFFQQVCLRASWNRIVTNYDRDTDVILGGIGYRF